MNHAEPEAKDLRFVAPKCWDYARRLRIALAPTLRRIRSERYKPGRLARLGVADFRRVMGKPVSIRHWRRILKRVLDRGGGLDPKRDPLAAYLPNVARTVAPGESPVPPSGFRAELDRWMDWVLSLSATRRSPAPADPEWLWHHAFEAFEFGLAEGRVWQAWQTHILARLWQGERRLAVSRGALERAFRRKFDAWIAGGRSPFVISDRRRSANWERREEVPASDRDAISAAARILGVDYRALYQWMHGRLSYRDRRLSMRSPAAGQPAATEAQGGAA